MSYENDQTEFIPVKLEDGTIFMVEVSHTGREDVGYDPLSFNQVSKTLEGIVKNLKDTLEKVKPDKAVVKLGLEMAVESGNLTAMLIKGTGKGNLEITLEWNK